MVLCDFINWGGAGRGEMVRGGREGRREGEREDRIEGWGGESHQVLIDFLQI